MTFVPDKALESVHEVRSVMGVPSLDRIKNDSGKG